jgi:hypothetical protein
MYSDGRMFDIYRSRYVEAGSVHIDRYVGMLACWRREMPVDCENRDRRSAGEERCLWTVRIEIDVVLAKRDA